MTKTIAVIAANGRTGRAFVASALEAGMIVRAGYHHKKNLPVHDNLLAVKCDVADEEDIRRLIDGADVVVSLIGHGRHSPPNLQSDAMAKVLRVMKRLNIRRIISLTGTGVRCHGDTPNFIDKLLNMAIKLVDPARISDGIHHSEILKSSTAEWTIIRVLKLTNGRSSQRVRFSICGPAEIFTPRVRVAHAILQIINDGSYKYEMPIIQGEITLAEKP